MSRARGLLWLLRSVRRWLGPKAPAAADPAEAAAPAEGLAMSVVLEEDFSAYDVSRVPDSELTWTPTVCPYCGVGCGLLIGSKDGKLHKSRGNPAHPANKGLLCAKGATLPQITDTSDRLAHPWMRASASEPFRRAGWPEAVREVADRIRSTVEKHGPDSFAFYISGQLLSEDYYVINKLAKGFLGTNNVDSNSRLCMASAVSGYVTSLGADGPPACYEDIELSDCFLLIGTNTAACHPVVFQRIKNRRAKGKGVFVIVADPRRTQTAEIADLYLPLRPGTDVALLNGMLHVLEKEGLLDQTFIGRSTSGWEALRAVAAEYTPERTAEVCGLSAQDVIAAARAFGRAPSALSFWSMGLNQSTSGTAKNNAVINLHLATGKIGKPGSGPFSLTGQPNAMGGRETGGLCHLLPGHRFVSKPEDRRAMEAHWGVPEGRLSARPGLSAVELFRSLEEGRTRIVWVIATNPVVSIPNADRVKRALAKAELVIVQDPYHPTETTRLAHVLLPAAQWSERDGTMTNSERRISHLKKIIDPPGEARPDWRIVSDVARAMGFGEAFDFQSAEDVFEEFKRTTRGTDMDLTGLTYARLGVEPAQWPFPEGAERGTARLYSDGRFGTAGGKARFLAQEYRAAAELPDADFPMVLTTGRVRDQWHTMTRTGKVDSLLRGEPYAFVEVHPEDAARLGIEDGEHVQVSTRRGCASAPARITEGVRPGLCFMPFHWGELFGDAAINLATQEAYDPISKQPELKFCACRLERMEAGLRAQGAL